MPKKKRSTKTRRKRTKRQSDSLFWAVTGLALLAFSGLAFSHFGWLGIQTANALRWLSGDAYLLTGGLIALFGAIMLIYNQPPRLRFKRYLGLMTAFLGLLVLLAHRFFGQEMVNSGFMNAFWHTMNAEFARAGVTMSVGGGLIGSLIYSELYPIIGGAGLIFLASFCLPVGLLMFFDVKFKSVLAKFQWLSQAFIAKNRAAGSHLKAKYHDLVVTKPDESAPDTTDTTDPFPNTTDFSQADVQVPVTNDAPQSPEPSVEPEPEISFPPVHHGEADLPKAHHFASDDAKMAQEAAVDHGELDLDRKTSATYKKPPLSLLDPLTANDQSADKALIRQNTTTLQHTFQSFGVEVHIKRAILGPTVTRYEVQPAVGVKVSRIVNLADDLALALAAKDIRIEAPIPGKPFIGIEVPNKVTSVVSFKDVMLNQSKVAKANPMMVPLGKAVSGLVVSANLAKMPHLLIAGSTGSGKSVAINTILTSILLKARPEEVKLILIDPKMVELSVYNQVPYLLIPVVTDAKLAANALHKAVKEMERRYQLFAAAGVRNMGEYNQKVAAHNEDRTQPVMPILPYILVVVDELSDLMMVGGHDVEGAIVRLGQMARAAGIHMILATQRPSVDVITGLIKANVPSRISFAVSSGVDSRTILDSVGAEKLLGRGDMLYLPIGAAKPERLQGAYVSSEEVEKVIAWCKKQQTADYNEDMMPKAVRENADLADDADTDEFYAQAVDLVRRQQSASVSMLQRRFRIGYNRAARMVDEMEAKGIVGPSEGSKPRQVLLPRIKNEGQADAQSNH
ncbi:MAG: DNA translocase FtsK [Lactobacillus sp.]|nr:DNA translocase FtsK [Lactobacillus sp.]MDN6052133.1 DNA translocase FtsK [Lactobacillus sp.]